MNDAQADFFNRVEDIEEYFSFIQLIDDDENTKVFIKGQEQFNTSSKLQKILRANAFILLYNLVEASMRNCIIAIYTSIENSNIDYSKLNHGFKTLWINQSTGSFKEKTFGLKQLNTAIEELLDRVSQKEMICFDRSKVSFDGNLDARKIREIAKKYGFEEPSDGSDLATIKTKRNHLAHGDFTFSDIGKDYTVNDLITFKSNVIEFLKEMMTHIKAFIDQSLFLD